MSDLHETITQHIVDQLETATAKGWRMPWHSSAAKSPAINVNTRAEYNGINRLMLGTAQRVLGYESPEWATYKQWQERGAQVRKGERGASVVKYGTFTRESENDDGEAETRGFLKGYTVFNADQVDGHDAAPIAKPYPANPEDRIAACEAFFANLGADIREGGSGAYFRPAEDFIAMPDYERFISAETYYSTLAHEATHWTGHKSRLDRPQTGKFGSPDYAFEELIAELGAAFMCDHLGLANEPREDHAAYIGSWLKALKDDKRCIFRAATAAQKAADFLKARQPLAVEAVQLRDGPALQILVPGVAPVAPVQAQIVQLCARRAQKRGTGALPAGGLFDDVARNQLSLF